MAGEKISANSRAEARSSAPPGDSRHMVALGKTLIAGMEGEARAT